MYENKLSILWLCIYLLFYVDWVSYCSIVIEYHVDDEDLPTEISKTFKPMTYNQPPKKTVAPECFSKMRFVKHSHSDLLVQ